MAAMQFSSDIGFAKNQMSRALDILLIMIGGRCFGLPLSRVNHICQLPPSFKSHGDEVESHFVFQGNPFPYLSLWNLLGLKTEYLEYEEMHPMLAQRRQDHLDWMSALEDSILNGTTFSKARNPRECAFGKWYYNYRPKNLRLALLMSQFERPHTEIHRLADQLLGMVEAGQTESALQAFHESKKTILAELFELFDSTQVVVTELQRRVAIVLVDGENTCVLGADGVREIVTTTDECIKPSGGVGSSVSSALIVLDDQSVVPLLNSCAFFTKTATQP
jgi:chemotaxis signal transduction protein